MLSRIKRLSHEKVLMRTKVAEATRLMESLSIHPNPIQNENVVYIGDADGKDPGHNIAAAATTHCRRIDPDHCRHVRPFPQ